MDKTKPRRGLTTIINYQHSFFWGDFLPDFNGAWAMPLTIRNLPTRRSIMKREPHSKYTHAIVEVKLTVTWNDGIVEDLTPHLPPELQANIEEYLVEMDDLRTQNPANYFL